MNEELCKEKHKRIDEKLRTHEKRLNNHADRLDIIERTNSKFEERFDNLIQQLGSLNKVLKWFIGLMTGALISFFFYVVQNNLK